MGYEEVETVLPADFVPRSDSPEQLQLSTSTTAVKGSTTNNTKQSEEEEEVVTKTKSRRSMSRGRSLKKGILNRWRRSKSRTSNKNKKKDSSSSSSNSNTNTTIKKSDSNVTKKVSNSSSKTPLVTEEQRGDEVADNNTASSSSINARESPNTLDTVDTNGEQQQQASATDNNNTAAVTKGGEVVDESLSVEVEDDSGSVKSLQIDKSPSNVSTKSNKSVKSNKSAKSTKSNKSATLDESGSVRSSRSNKSTKSTASSKKQVKSSKSQEDDGQAKYTSSSQENVAAAAAPEEAPSSKNKEGQEEKWVKKVSLSIGGYKTSFQFSDPTTSLANAVNDALTVVGGAVDTTTNTLEQQQADKQHLGTIGETTEGIITDEAKECDYDVNPTKLFMYLQQRAWAKALHHLQSNQNESSMWVYRKVKTPTPSTDDDANVVNSSTALVVVPQEEEDAVVTPKYRWRLLPLHAAIVLGAPTEIIQAIISSHPNAARETDERGSLPVHLAASRLDVDPEGEKVVLQLFGVYPDSIDVQDRKGRTPPELAKLARSRKEIEENRKQEVKDDTEENIEGECADVDDDDDVSVKSSISGRFAALLKGSKSTDTADVRGRRKKKKKKKGKKNTSSQPLGLTSAKSMGADDDDDDDESVIADDASIAESLGPGFAFLKTSKPQEERERQEAHDGKTTQEDEQTYDDIVKTAKKAIISKEYQTPEDAPQDTISPQSIPLPMSFSMGDDVSTAVASMAGSVSDALTSLAASASFSNKDEQQQQQNTKSVTISDEPPQIQTEDNSDESTIASSVDTTVTGNTKIKANEGLRALLEKAVENAGRGGMDVTKFVDLLEDEWVTDVEALRRLDGQTLDRLLPLMLSREIQRLINHADNIDNKFLKAETKRGRSMKKGKNNKKKKRSANISSKKKKVRSITPPSESSLMTIAEDLEASPGDDQTIYSIKTERAPSRPKNGLAESADTEAKDEPVVEDMVVEQSASLEDLEIRRLHANLIADARKKFPTREALEVCIRERQEEVERAVKSGFDVDKETLACAALADDEVRRLLPLRLILPTADDLREMIQVLQTHKEEAMRSLDMIQAANIQSEVDELQEQIDEEDRYMLKKRMGETQCESCGEMFTSEKKLKGILKVNQKSCQGCRNDNVDSRDDV